MPTTTTGERKAGQVWTIEEVRELGLTTDVETAAAILGIGRTKAYALARTGEFPVRLLRVGRRYVVPVQAILNILAVE
ncbi:DNA-binding protein [Verrucosispora sp. FIM060022]|nr:DNA-binding protein [Verrucosispora sp. FIM060022]